MQQSHWSTILSNGRHAPIAEMAGWHNKLSDFATHLLLSLDCGSLSSSVKNNFFLKDFFFHLLNASDHQTNFNIRRTGPHTRGKLRYKGIFNFYQLVSFRRSVPTWICGGDFRFGWWQEGLPVSPPKKHLGRIWENTQKAHQQLEERADCCNDKKYFSNYYWEEHEGVSTYNFVS